jgi:hypothetical protein
MKYERRKKWSEEKVKSITMSACLSVWASPPFLYHRQNRHWKPSTEGMREKSAGNGKAATSHPYHKREITSGVSGRVFETPQSPNSNLKANTIIRLTPVPSFLSYPPFAV